MLKLQTSNLKGVAVIVFDYHYLYDSLSSFSLKWTLVLPSEPSPNIRDQDKVAFPPPLSLVGNGKRETRAIWKQTGKGTGRNGTRDRCANFRGIYEILIPSHYIIVPSSWRQHLCLLYTLLFVCTFPRWISKEKRCNFHSFHLLKGLECCSVTPIKEGVWWMRQ